MCWVAVFVPPKTATQHMCWAADLGGTKTATQHIFFVLGGCSPRKTAEILKGPRNFELAPQFSNIVETLN